MAKKVDKHLKIEHPFADSSENNMGWISPQSAQSLLNTPLRQRYLSLLWQQVSMSREMFNHLYQHPIEKYAEMVQLLPASEGHHHAHLGGMLDHGLEVISIASKLRQSYVLPQNAAPEEQSRQRDAWTATVIYAALVHDIGKVVADITMELKSGERWFAWNGIPKAPYKFRYIKGRDYHLHPVLGSYFLGELIPKEALAWLAEFPEAFTGLMYAAAGHWDKAGLLSEIVQKADQHSVTLALGGDVKNIANQPVKSFAKQLVIALRYVVTNEFKLNTPKGPADAWLTEDGLWLMSKTVADKVRAHLMGQGVSVPKDNIRLFDEMQSLGLVDKTESDTAIWHCFVRADSGWTPPKPFTLLRCRPEVIWENIEDRPTLFAGRIVLDESKSNEEKTDNSASHVTPNQESAVQVEPDLVLPEKGKSIDGEIAGSSMAKTAPKENATVPDEIDSVLSLFTDIAPSVKVETKQDDSVADSHVDTYSDNHTNEAKSVLRKPKVKPKDTKTDNVLTANESTEEMVLPQMDKETVHISLAEHCDNDKTPGELFVEWLRHNLATDKLVMNKPTAKVHYVDNCLFLVTPSIFQIYLQQNAKKSDTENVMQLQYSFQELGLHKRRILETGDSTNFWTCTVSGPRKNSSLTGYLIDKPNMILGNKKVFNNLRIQLNKV